jgi:Polyketide synthase dehydratase
MAVEALMQVADNQCLLKPLQGYTIQALNITSALIIPPEGSIETLVNVLELRGCTRNSVKWFDFRVSSVTEDGKWAEHGAGMIGLVESNGDPPEEKPLIRRSKVSNARKWYAALSTVGVEFGPTFQTLSDISLVSEKNEAIANIALHSTKNVMTAESRYVIHPTTLDGCLQMSVMAAHGTTKSVSKAFLPVSVEDLTVWTPSVSDPTPEDALVYAQGKLRGLRSVHGIAKVFSKNGKLLVNGRVSFLSLEGSLTNSKATVPRQPYSRLVWKPDVDRLGTPANYLDYHQYATASLPESEKFHLADFIDLLVHKGRSLRILQIGCGSLESTVKALHGDSSQPLYSQYMVASKSTSTFEEAKKTFQGFKNMDFCSFDVEGSIAELTLDAQSYDLAILSEVSEKLELLKGALVLTNHRLMISRIVPSNS